MQTVPLYPSWYLYNVYKCTTLRVKLSMSYRNPLYPTCHCVFHRFYYVTNGTHTSNLLIFTSTTLQNSTVIIHEESTVLRASPSQQNEHVFMYNVICKRILICNHLRLRLEVRIQDRNHELALNKLQFSCLEGSRIGERKHRSNAVRYSALCVSLHTIQKPPALYCSVS
jgi:hypothetical protein